MAKGKTSKVVEFSTDFRGKWFQPLQQNQIIKGVFTREFKTDSKFKNSREDSDNFGKKTKSNYEITLDGNKGKINFSEGGGPLQALLDALSIGDRVEIHYSHLEKKDGEKCPVTVKTSEQLKKWRGGKNNPCYPRFTVLKLFKK